MDNIVQAGTIDLLSLITIFVGLQFFWIIPILKRDNKLNKRGRNIKEEIIKLEKIYNKY